jgi:hypothetical protein
MWYVPAWLLMSVTRSSTSDAASGDPRPSLRRPVGNVLAPVLDVLQEVGWAVTVDQDHGGEILAGRRLGPVEVHQEVPRWQSLVREVALAFNPVHP